MINIEGLSVDVIWMLEQAQIYIKKARRIALDGTVIYSPTAEDFYGDATYLRDFVYMIGCPNDIPFEEALGNLQLFFKHQRQDGALPVFIQYKKGIVVYKSHGVDIPDSDTVPFAIIGLWRLWKKKKDSSVFKKFRKQLRLALNTVITDPKTGLIYVDPKLVHTSYGFTDTIGKSGRELFCSLLLIEAYIKLAEMEKSCGNEMQAKKDESEAKRIGSNLNVLWDEKEGCLLAADIVCRQPDVWGNAYAVYSNAVDGKIAKKISEWFCRNYDRIIFKGMVRHLPEPMHWENKIYKDDEGPNSTYWFQDNFYWTHPVGWVANAISVTKPALAKKLIRETIKEMQTNGIWECYNKETQHYRAKGNLSSIVVPLEAILAGGVKI